MEEEGEKEESKPLSRLEKRRLRKARQRAAENAEANDEGGSPGRKPMSMSRQLSISGRNVARISHEFKEELEASRDAIDSERDRQRQNSKTRLENSRTERLNAAGTAAAEGKFDMAMALASPGKLSNKKSFKSAAQKVAAINTLDGLIRPRASASFFSIDLSVSANTGIFSRKVTCSLSISSLREASAYRNTAWSSTHVVTALFAWMVAVRGHS